MRALLRLLGLVWLAGGFAALVVDGTRSIAADNLTFTQLRDTLAWMAPRLSETEPGAEKAHSLLQSASFMHVLDVPTWLVFCLAGLLLIYIGRPRAARIGFSNRP